jgi:hypothetical protein
MGYNRSGHTAKLRKKRRMREERRLAAKAAATQKVGEAGTPAVQAVKKATT